MFVYVSVNVHENLHKICGKSILAYLEAKVQVRKLFFFLKIIECRAVMKVSHPSFVCKLIHIKN